ncbi:MAG: hypothetical protein ACI4MO_03420 [Christensenellales bacterium]
MKKKLIVALLCIVLCVVACVSLSACNGDGEDGGLTKAYESYVTYTQSKGNTPLSYEDWLGVITGDAGGQGIQGEKGEQGEQGANGTNGTNGINGTNGTNGENGLSAYEIYKKYHPAYSGTEKEWIDAMASGEIAASYTTEYNIVFTTATIPPVLAALESMANGFPTYAYIERGKTYYGIEQIDNFNNIGFDANNNSSSGFGQAQMDLVVNKIKELNVFGNEKFNIYVCDYHAVLGFAVAGNSQLTDDQFNLYLCEDGTGAYNGFRANYANASMTVDEQTDEPYDTLLANVEVVKEMYDTYMNKTDTPAAEVNSWTHYDWAFAAATLDNVTYLMQDSNAIKTMLEALGDASNKTKMLSVCGVAGYDDEVEVNINFDFASISSKVGSFSAEKKESYLRLMYGNYYNDTYNTLMRTTFADSTPAPAKKLVFISSRVKSYPNFAANGDYGFTAVTSASQIPATYAELNDMYKSDLLFGTEDDYNLFINTFYNPSLYEENSVPSEEILNAIKVNAFNYYINYMFTLKFTYLRYGSEFDIILKGHPREVLGEYGTWSAHYDVTYGAGQTYRYDRLYDSLLLDFHRVDSVGKKIGLVPFGTAAENLAYLGADISICGLPSSTYTGYDTDVDVKFIMARTNAAITSDSNLASRYEQGNLLDHDSLGNPVVTAYFNNGNIYKELIAYYTDKGDATKQAQYQDLFEKWLRNVNGLAADADVTGYDVDAQGFLVTP